MIDRGTQKTLEEIRKYDVYYADEWEDMQSAEHKRMIDDALQYYEDVFNPGKGANWKWKNKHRQLELYDWNFASENKPLEEHLRTLFTLTWS